jgi:hypothetical protein
MVNTSRLVTHIALSKARLTYMFFVHELLEKYLQLIDMSII